ncbi:DUF3499 domain-containing protein [Gordonia sp. CPCC 205333]|uniref:DUF3499 domain-containing protein n=1 Tax=Gordonia sp. CPCC 205333 TaxID=3140790 RepID=UPI003AF34E6C
MSSPRQCRRPGCSRAAVATLTFVYAESTAVIGPLSTNPEPHAWDLCVEHAETITVPRGWEMLRSERTFSAPPEDLELTALAEAVRESGKAVGSVPLDGLDDLPLHRSASSSANARFDRMAPAEGGRHRAPVKPRPGRRGHLRVLPDPVD